MNRLTRTILILAALSGLILGGCASESLMLRPGNIDVAAAGGQTNRWSLWVEEARDLRPEPTTGPKVGAIDQRFSEQPTTVYLEPAPADYVRAEMGRYLLANGLEASSADRARALLSLELLRFEITRNSKDVFDQVTVSVEIKANFRDRSGNDLGAVKVPAERSIQTPVGSREKMQELVRATLGDVFEALAASETFRRAAGLAE